MCAQVALEDVVIGQYRSRTTGGKTLPGYLDDDTVPAGRCVPYNPSSEVMSLVPGRLFPMCPPSAGGGLAHAAAPLRLTHTTC